MRLLPGTKKFCFRTIVLTQAQQRSRLFVCLFRMPSFSAPAPPNRFRYPGTRLLRPEQDGRERLRPSGRSAAASGGPAGRPTRSAHLCGSRHGYSGPRIVPSACTPEPLSVSRRPSAPSGSLFRMPPGPAAPIDRKRLFPARESCLPPAPPPSLAPAPPNRFRYPGARLLRPEQDGRERLRPSGRSAAASGGPAGRPTPATLREKCRGIRRSGRSAHPCGPRHGYSAPPVADGVFSVHRCFSISTNHSGQRHGRRVSLRMNPSTVDPVLSSSPRSFRIS